MGPPRQVTVLFIKKINGGQPQKQETEANKRTPHLREEVPYQITLIRLRQWQGSLDRGRREKVIRKMFPEDDCNPFTDLEGESRSKKCGDGRGGPRCLVSK